MSENSNLKEQTKGSHLSPGCYPYRCQGITPLRGVLSLDKDNKPRLTTGGGLDYDSNRLVRYRFLYFGQIINLENLGTTNK